MSRLTVLVVAFALLLATMLLTASASTSSAAIKPFCVTEFSLPSGSPGWLTPGSDGNVWFIHYLGGGAAALAHITPTGAITDFPVPGTPLRVVSGSDGNLWYTRSDTSVVGRMTLTGIVTTFALPTGANSPYGIAIGSDGNLWVAERFGNQILQIATNGTVSNQFPIPTASSNPTDIVPGADGKLYFIESTANKIGRITTAGVITEFAITTPGVTLVGIAPGPDGSVWFTEYSTCGFPPPPGCTINNRISNIAPDGTVAEHDSGFLRHMTTGSDGNLWAIQDFYHGEGTVGINTNGVAVASTTLSCQSTPYCLGLSFTSITSGGDGKIWVGSVNPYRIATFDPRTGLCYYYFPFVYR